MYEHIEGKNMKSISINVGYFGNSFNGKRTTLKSLMETAKTIWSEDIEEYNFNSLILNDNAYISCGIKIPVNLLQIKSEILSIIQSLNVKIINIKTYIVPERLQNDICKNLISEAHGIIFVADAIPERFVFDKSTMYELLNFYKYKKQIALQYNKRDIQNATPLNILQETFNLQSDLLESPSIAYYKLSRVNGELKLIPPDRKNFTTQLGHINLFKNLVAKIINNFCDEDFQKNIITTDST